MKPILNIFIIIAIFLFSCTVEGTLNDIEGGRSGVENKQPVVSKQMTLISKNPDRIKVYISGVGTIEIDWGDGTEVKTYTISPAYSSDFTHVYSGTAVHTIKISGENIAYLDCSNCRLISLDVSQNTALTELYCYLNQLTGLDVSKNTALFSLDISTNQLDTGALDILFGTLHNHPVAEEKIIYIKKNPGTDNCRKYLAEDKGWKVDTAREWIVQ